MPGLFYLICCKGIPYNHLSILKHRRQFYNHCSNDCTEKGNKRSVWYIWCVYRLTWDELTILLLSLHQSIHRTLFPWPFRVRLVFMTNWPKASVFSATWCTDPKDTTFCLFADFILHEYALQIPTLLTFTGIVIIASYQTINEQEQAFKKIINNKWTHKR